mgnify:CR=1 FL=1
MNKKGFTLAELLGVIVLLGILATVAFPPLLNQLNKSKEKLSGATLKVLGTAAEQYIDDHSSSYPIKEGKTYCISLETLVNYNYLKSPIMDASTGEEISEKDNYKESIEKINKTDADYLHLDVMDGSFTESSSFSLNESKEIKDLCNKKVDVHIMSINLRKIISEYININPYNITFHIENNDIEKYIDLIKEKNIKVGLAINPDTDLSTIYPYLDKIDRVLVMSVVPGKGGQKFMESVIPKLIYLKENKDKYNYEIEVDGGINSDTVNFVKDYADIVVSGSFITNSNGYQESINKLK